MYRMSLDINTKNSPIGRCYDVMSPDGRVVLEKCSESLAKDIVMRANMGHWTEDNIVYLDFTGGSSFDDMKNSVQSRNLGSGQKQKRG